MPGIFDIFGGGGGDPLGFDFSSIADAGNIDPGISDFLGSTQPFSFDNLAGTLGNIGSTIGDIGSTFGGFTIPGAVSPGTFDWSGITRALTGGGGGSSVATSIFNNPLTRPLIQQGLGAITGGGSSQPGSAGTPGTPRTVTTPVAGSGLPGSGSPVSSILGGGGLGGLLSNPALLAMIPSIFQAISAKDQTDLGPDAANLRALATKNQGTIDSLQQEAAAEKMGQLPGPVLSSLEDSLAQQKAGFATNYSRMGMDGSTASAADAAALNRKSEQDRMQIGLNMASEGLSQVQALTGQDVGIYNDLMGAQATRDNEYMQAMADLAQALGQAFGGPSTTVNVGGSGAGTGVPQGGTATNPGSSTPIDISSLTGPLTPFIPSVVQPGVDPSTLITPQTQVPDLVTPNLPDLSSLDTSTDPNAVAAYDFLRPFLDMQSAGNPGGI